MFKILEASAAWSASWARSSSWAIGIHALRARSRAGGSKPVDVSALRVGPATLETLDGAVWSAYPFALTAGPGGDAPFEGRTFAVEPREFAVLGSR